MQLDTSWRSESVHLPICPSKKSSYHALYCISFPPFRAISYYKRAADLGDKRAAQRLKSSPNAPLPQPGGPGSILRRDGGDSASASGSGKSGGKDKDCVIM